MTMQSRTHSRASLDFGFQTPDSRPQPRTGHPPLNRQDMHGLTPYRDWIQSHVHQFLVPNPKSKIENSTRPLNRQKKARAHPPQRMDAVTMYTRSWSPIRNPKFSPP
jgi:hypothetical protein